MLIFSTLFLLNLSIGITNGVNVDKTLTPGAVGHDVVYAVIRKLSASNVFFPERSFMKRVAWFSSRDGNLIAGQNNSGGIWRILRWQFDATKDWHRFSVDLEPVCADVKAVWNINWHQVAFHDLDKPLYSGLAFAIFSTIRPWRYDPIPISLIEQRDYFIKLYQLPSKVGEQFHGKVMEHEQSVTCQARRDVAIIVPVSDCVDEKLFLFLERVVDGLELEQTDTTISFLFVDSSLLYDLHLRSTNASSAKFYLRTNAFVRNKLCEEVNFVRQSSINHVGKSIESALTSIYPYFRRPGSGSVPVFIIITDAYAKDDIKTPSRKAKHLGITMVAVSASYHVEWSHLLIMTNNVTWNILEANHVGSMEEDIYQRLIEATCLTPAIVPPKMRLKRKSIGSLLMPGRSIFYNIKHIPKDGSLSVCFQSNPKSAIKAYTSWSISNPNQALYDEMYSSSFQQKV